MKPSRLFMLLRNGALLCALAVASCSTAGVGGAAPPANAGVGGSSPTPASATMFIRVLIPSKLASQSATAGQLETDARWRVPKYVSPSSKSLNIALTPAGMTSEQSRSFPCSSSSCTAQFSAPAGDASIALSLTDGSGGGGNTLSLTHPIPIRVVANVTNAFNFTTDPVVATSAVLLGVTPAATADVNGGSVGDIPITIQAYDADHNVIIGPGNYVDATGAPVTLTLVTANSAAGGTGTVTIHGSPNVKGPGPSVATAHYDGGWFDSSSISVTATTGLVGPGISAKLSTTPHVTEYQNGIPTGSGLYGITSGPDGNLWSVSYGGGSGQAIIRTSASGNNTVFTAGISPGAGMSHIVSGPDGALWFTESMLRRIGRITTGGSVTEFAGMTGLFPAKIISGPLGKLWFVEELSNKVGSITTAGAISEAPLNGSQPRGIVLGPDGNLWITYRYSAMLTRLTPAGTETDFPYPGATGGQPDGPAVGPDGNIWSASSDGTFIIRYEMSTGLITEYTAGISANAFIENLAVGADGAIWFDEGSTAKIGRISMNGTVSEYGAINGISGASNPSGLTRGADGNIWFAEYNNDAVAKLIY